MENFSVLLQSGVAAITGRREILSGQSQGSS
jgi:hypothetical protein